MGSRWSAPFRLTGAVHRAELVPGRIAQIGQIKRAKAGLANAWWIFAGRTARRDARSVPGIGLCRGGHAKTDGSAIGACRRLAIDRLGHKEQAAIMHVDQAAKVIREAWFTTNRLKQRIVKYPGAIDIVGAHHNVTEHEISLFAGLAERIAMRRTNGWGQLHQPNPRRQSAWVSEDRAVEEPADNQQARHDADTITKDVDTRHHKHPSNKGDLRRLDGKITSVFTLRE